MQVTNSDLQISNMTRTLYLWTERGRGLLRGGELRDFKSKGNEINFHIPPTINRLYLWTERGTFKHMKMIGTDEAWAGYDMLLDPYFRAKEMLPQKPDSYMIENPAERARRWIEEYEEKVVLEGRIEELTDCDKREGEYEAHEIAKMFHIYSKSGLPHSKLIGGIRKYLGDNPEHFRVVKTQQGPFYANSYIGELKLNSSRFYYRCA